MKYRSVTYITIYYFKFYISNINWVALSKWYTSCPIWHPQAWQIIKKNKQLKSTALKKAMHKILNNIKVSYKTKTNNIKSF